MKKYALAIFPEEPRCLVSISHNMISFNLSAFMLFDSRKEAEQFKERWSHHFFGLEKLTVIEVKEK